jgi:hypothetical protein
MSVSKEIKRCDECKKKIGLMEYKCKCGNIYCISHLQAEKHRCTFDYKSEGRKRMMDEHEKVGVLSDKLIRI